MNARIFLAKHQANLPSDSKNRYLRARMASVLSDAVNNTATLDYGQRCFVARAIQLAAENDGKLFRQNFSEQVLVIATYINTCK